MIHSIISWDCCYRNFFHLIGSLAEQDYPKDQFEIIYVEQWSREQSDAFNHSMNLKSLGETVALYSDRINVQAVYLDKIHSPYHLGISNNAGIRMAKGKYISVMDGDLLVEKDFLRKLEKAHEEKNCVLNLDRRYALGPAGVPESRWMEAEIDFERVLRQCTNQERIIPDKVENKGPMISAPQSWWKAVDGYDEHRIWSTGVSKSGQDVTRRLEMYCGKESIALPGTFSVHPYHPAGFNRGAAAEKLVLYAQQKIIDYSREHGITKVKQREAYVEKIYTKYKWVIEANIQGKTNYFVQALSKSIDIYHRGLAKLKSAD